MTALGLDASPDPDEAELELLSWTWAEDSPLLGVVAVVAVEAASVELSLDWAELVCACELELDACASRAR